METLLEHFLAILRTRLPSCCSCGYVERLGLLLCMIFIELNRFVRHGALCFMGEGPPSVMLFNSATLLERSLCNVMLLSDFLTLVLA